MRKTQKRQIEELIEQIEQVHDQIKEYIEQKSNQFAMKLLEDCQSAGISIGTLIESTEGEGHPTVSKLEEYCELAYQIHQNLAEGKEANSNKIYKVLRQKLIKASNSIRNDILIRKEAVFLPYKASMWDSLESIWQAANADPNCDAYVIPIPYFERNPDGSFGQMHCEADQYPDYVPITKYDAFDFGIHHPDMIFIHNPYDNMNLVTSIHPFFYSDKMKKVTDCLVYIPYFVTSGGISESKAMCPAYVNADYIVIQSEEYRKYFDMRLDDEKFLVFGSPKFDSVINKCQNPPEPSIEWKEKIEGKKIYFYNTSIAGMLANTDMFLKKMRYVFDIFKERKDACLLWRPHPLLESTFDAMRKQYKPQFEALKKEFEEEHIGVFDNTADIEHTIALSDAYIGDAGSSVIALFGITGKPLFILSNYIHTLPEKDDWRGSWIYYAFDMWPSDKYLITQNNQLWISEDNKYHYRFYMNLECQYSGNYYYKKAVEIKNKLYVLPFIASDLLIIENKKIRKINLKPHITQWSFHDYFYNEKYIFLIPNQYPYLVRFDVDTEEICYVNGIRQFNTRTVNGEWLSGGVAIYKNDLIFASPVDNQFVFMDMDTLKTRTVSSASKCNVGTMKIVPYGDELWLLPMNGTTVICWNIKTGKIEEYNDVPQGFKSFKLPYEFECDEKPFGNIAVSNKSGRQNIIISPYLGNMYLSLDRETGKMEEWETPIPFKNHGKNGYFFTSSMGGFVTRQMPQDSAVHQIFDAAERKLYDVNIDTKEFREVEIAFDYNDVREHESGFAEQTVQMPYALYESALNSLKDFLDNNITGNPFDRNRQLKAFAKMNVNMDGTCGKKVYDYVKGRI